MTTKLDHDKIVRGQREGLVRFLRLLGCDGPTADDLAQEAFIALLDAEFEHRHPSATAAWLRKKARFLFLDTVRIRDRRREALRAGIAEEVWIECAGDDDGAGYRDALRECLDVLPARSREAVRLRYAEKANRDAMAKALGLRPNGVKTLLQRIRAALRHCVEKRRAR